VHTCRSRLSKGSRFPSNASPYGIWIVARAATLGKRQQLGSGRPSAYSDGSARSRARSSRINSTSSRSSTSKLERVGRARKKPQDQNRDWIDAPIIPLSAALQQKWGAPEHPKTNTHWPLDMFLDLHHPGPGDKSSFFCISPAAFWLKKVGQNVDRLLNAAANLDNRPAASAAPSARIRPRG